MSAYHWNASYAYYCEIAKSQYSTCVLGLCWLVTQGWMQFLNPCSLIKNPDISFLVLIIPVI